MLISLVGDMIDVSDEERQAIAYVATGGPENGDPSDDKADRGEVVAYLKCTFAKILGEDVQEYHEAQRIAKIAALKAEAAAKLEEAKELEESDG